jgi:hypothetical protein
LAPGAWDRSLAWSESQASKPKQLVARLSRLSCSIETLDSDATRRLLAVVPYVHNDYAADKMVEELLRLVDSNPHVTAEVLERMLDASAPTYDLDNKLKNLIEKQAGHGLRDEAIRCTEKVRRTLPGMLDLYEKLVAAN